jgi:LmbE family N-acetylglucosaminyl deacetylase
MKKILVVAPHADDESLGCGGTILKHIANGDEVYWLLVTGMSKETGFTELQIETRRVEISKVIESYNITETFQLRLPPAKLDILALADVVGAISDVVNQVQPEVVYTVYRNDAHSDHEVVFDAVMSATKSFRYPFVKRVLAYETISETDFSMKPEDPGFRPNVFVNIEKYLDKKLNILNIFESEMGVFPFPRSLKAIRSLAYLRGVQSNCEAAESFMLLKEIS